MKRFFYQFCLLGMVLWTLLMAVVGLATMGEQAKQVSQIQNSENEYKDEQMAGAGIGATLSWVVLGALWLCPFLFFALMAIVLKPSAKLEASQKEKPLVDL